jgi:hypothetical protein
MPPKRRSDLRLTQRKTRYLFTVVCKKRQLWSSPLVSLMWMTRLMRCALRRVRYESTTMRRKTTVSQRSMTRL